MTSRDRTTRARHLLTATLVALGALAAHGLAPAAAVNVPDKPNLVLIVTDDQAIGDLYQRTHPKGGEPVMPETLHNLPEAGVTFRRAYSSNPLSCPSRSTILTGQYAVNHHIYGNRWPGGGWQDMCAGARHAPVGHERPGSRSEPARLRPAEDSHGSDCPQ